MVAFNTSLLSAAVGGAVNVRTVATALDNGTLGRIADRPANVMWSKDRNIAGLARAVDGRVCINEPVRKFDPASPCGSDAQACLWKFVQVDTQCNAQTYGSVLFQVDRYVWAQSQLSALLAAQPGGGLVNSNRPEYAAAWSDWCLKVMQLVSFARWATNVRPEYLPDVDEMPEAARVAQVLEGQRRSVPSKLHQEDAAPVQDQFVRVLFKPSMKRVFADRVFSNAADAFSNDLTVSFPTAPADFDPFMTVSGHGTTLGPGSLTTNFSLPPPPLVAGQYYRSGVKCHVTQWDINSAGGATIGIQRKNPWPWPESWAPIPYGSQSDSISSRMLMWFQATLGTGSWVGVANAGQIQAQYPTNYRGANVTCTGGGVTAARCTGLAYVRFWWGTAAAQIQMCEAWAKDIVNTSFEAVVAAGLQSFIEAYSRIPDNLKVLDYNSLTQIRSQITSSNLQGASTEFLVAAGLAGAAASAINPVAGAVVAAVGLLMQGVTELLKALKLLAYGGGDIVAACIPPPVFRMIQTPDSHACDFNTADGELPATVDRVSAIQAAAAAGVPVPMWHDLAQTASGETQPPLQIPLAMPQRSKAGLWVLGGLGLLIGGVIVYKATH